MKRAFTFAMIVLFAATIVMAQEGRRGTARERWYADEIVTLKGEVTNVVLPMATLKSESKEYTVHLGPIWYWKDNNYKLEKGEVEIRGEVENENGALHLYPYKITQGKAIIELANDEGVPNWSRRSVRGRMSGRGHHGHHGCCGRGCW
jgi:hypothetical protein